jgi:hypothetical protein
MADDKSDAKSLEMRLAALEDKLAKLSISEEDMKTYERVANALGGSQTAAQPAPDTCQVCHITRQRLVCINRGIIPRQIIRFCNECQCGPCNMGGGGFSGGGGFGDLG